MRFQILLLLLASAGCTIVTSPQELRRAGGSAQGLQCVLNSDCPGDQVCAFRVCSPRCQTDKDCDDAANEVCFISDEASACVTLDRTACTSDDDCPEPTQCLQNECRKSCDTAQRSACREGQTCVALAARAREAGACRFEIETQAADAGDALADGGQATGADADAGPSPTRECSGEERTCMGERAHRCREDGRWDDGIACPYVCADGQCVGECTPQAQRCQDTSRQRCNARGEWEALETCEQVCTPDECVPACEEGVLQCNDGDLLRCNRRGVFELYEDCPYVCRDQACAGVCSPSETSCSSGTQLTCDAQGEWADATTCMFACEGALCGGECVPQSEGCASPAERRVCGDDGLWQAGEACTDSACVNGTCVGVCSPGAERCRDNAVERCSSTGAWQPVTTCVGSTCVDDGTPACQGRCEQGDQRCSADEDNAYEVCTSQGQWGDPVDCGAAACDADTGQCTGSCAPNSRRCEPGSALQTQVCTAAGVWRDSTRCEDSACVAGVCQGNCEPGTRRCASSSQYQVCNSRGRFGSEQACNNSACTGAGQCTGECSPGDTRCHSATQIEVCDARGEFQRSQCDDQACSGGACVGQCSPGSAGCEGNTPRTCSGVGQWIDATACPWPAQICSSGVCATNELQNLGNDGPFAGSRSMLGNWLYFYPLPRLSQDMALFFFGILGTPESVGSVKMYLYGSDAEGDAPDGTVLAATSAPIVLSGGAVEQAASSNVTLRAGRTYWLGVVANTTTTLASDVTPGAVGRRTSHTYTLPPPVYDDDFSGLGANDNPWGAYVRLRSLPPP